jgi:hypothetical protein
MTDRDRLIELIRQAKDKTPCSYNPDIDCEDIVCSACENGSIADYLLANGVIVPPCKVGDKLYVVGVFTGQVIPTVVIGIDYTANDMLLHLDNSNFVSVVHQLGKTVFLTKEEAEAELEKRCNDG